MGEKYEWHMDPLLSTAIIILVMVRIVAVFLNRQQREISQHSDAIAIYEQAHLGSSLFEYLNFR